MTVHPEHGLLVFVDCTPSEQLVMKDNRKLCMVGVVCDVDEGVPGLVKGYKGTARTTRLKRARLLEEALKSTTEVHAVGVCARERFLSDWACDLVNEVRPAIGAEWTHDASHFTFGDERFPRTLVLGIAAYAPMLALLGFRVSSWLKRMGSTRRACFILDKLPLERNGAVINLLELLTKKSTVGRDLWAENTLDSGGCEFTFRNMENYRPNAEADAIDAKLHPHFVLADWLAASLNAAYDPESYTRRGGGNLKDHEVAEIAAAWRTLESRGLGKKYDLEDIQEQMKAKEATRVQPSPRQRVRVIVAFTASILLALVGAGLSFSSFVPKVEFQGLVISAFCNLASLGLLTVCWAHIPLVARGIGLVAAAISAIGLLEVAWRIGW